eukprot:765960-Hanusia_phi.AAC.5
MEPVRDFHPSSTPLPHRLQRSIAPGQVRWVCGEEVRAGELVEWSQTPLPLNKERSLREVRRREPRPTGRYLVLERGLASRTSMSLRQLVFDTLV